MQHPKGQASLQGIEAGGRHRSPGYVHSGNTCSSARGAERQRACASTDLEDLRRRANPFCRQCVGEELCVGLRAVHTGQGQEPRGEHVLMYSRTGHRSLRYVVCPQRELDREHSLAVPSALNAAEGTVAVRSDGPQARIKGSGGISAGEPT